MWHHFKCLVNPASSFAELKECDAGWCCSSCWKSALPFADSSLSSPVSAAVRPGPPPVDVVTLDAACSQAGGESSAESIESAAAGGLSVLYTNCRSLLRNLDDLRAMVAIAQPDVIALCETWLGPEIRSCEVGLPSYSLVRHDRSRHGGGVLLYIRESIMVLSCRRDERAELLSAVLSTSGGPLWVGVLYRPPGTSLSLEDLESVLLAQDLSAHRKAILIGDFNIDLMSDVGSDLLDMTSSLGLTQLVREPTRVTASSATLIDHVHASSPSLVSSLCVGPPLGSSDHCCLELTLSIALPRSRQPRRKVWLYQRANFEGMNDHLSDVLGEEAVEHGDVDDVWGSFKEAVLGAMQKFVPSRFVRWGRNLPWVTQKVQRLLRKRAKAHRKAKRDGTEEGWACFRALRNRAVSILRVERLSYFRTLSKQLSNLKDFWASYSAICREYRRVPQVLRRGSVSATTSLQKASLLNEQFVSSFTSSPPTLLSPRPLPPSDVPALSSVECSSVAVARVLKSMRPKIASGPDGISSRILRGCLPSICLPLANLFKLSLSSGRVPSDWKLSNVVPIPKGGDDGLASNYRPISLLSLSSKVLERLIHNALLEHVLVNDLISGKQFGFRPGASTQEAILSATREWHEALEERNSVLCVFLDVSKAFDSLPHHLVLQSLVRVGVSGCLYDWFVDYLSGRQQRVVLDGVSSPTACVTSGVPQGSILGPLLFILSMDQLCRLSLSNASRLGMFADDIVYSHVVSSPLEVLTAQCDVDIIAEWVRSRGLRFNTSKSKIMVISRKRTRPVCSITIDGQQLEEVSSIKYLGVTISSDLSWGLHISTICFKARQLLGFLYRSFRPAGRGCLNRLYLTIVRPVLEYCGAVWDPHQLYNISKLERVQSFGARLVTGQWSSSGSALCEELGWPSLARRRSFHRLCLCRRILEGGSLIPDSTFIPSTSVTSSRRPSNSCPLHVPFVRTAYHQQSFFVKTVSLWNALPDRIISLPSTLVFKRQLKSYLVA